MVGNVGIFLLIVGFVGFLTSSKVMFSSSYKISKSVVKYLESKYVVGSKIQEEEGFPTVNLRELLSLIPALFLFVTFVGVVLISLTIFIYD